MSVMTETETQNARRRRRKLQADQREQRRQSLAAHASPNDPDMLLDTTQTAALIGVKCNTVEHWRMTGEGPEFVPISARCVRYRRGDVLRWIDERRVASTSGRIGGPNHAA